MSRRSSSAGPGGVSLFPFLSILASIIGILTLMISLVSNIQDQPPAERDPEEAKRAAEHQKVQADIRRRRAELARVEAELAKRDGAFVELEELEDRRVLLRRKLPDAAEAPAKNADALLQKQVENLLDGIAALKKERPSLEAKLAELRAELARRKIKPDAVPPPVQIRPGGSGITRNTKAIFIECHASGVNILGRDGSRVPVSSASIQTEPALSKVMNDAKSARDSMVIFLIRSNGHWTYQNVAGWAESTFQIRTGKLPIPGSGAIDLSLFFPK